MRACTSAQLISIARRGPELLARVTEGVFAGEEGLRIEAKIVPVAALKASLLPGKARLIEAWNALGAVRGPSPRVLQDVRWVLSQTVPEPGGGASAPLPAEWDSPPENPRATAAHPRAYRGTKSQPPKPKRMAPIDLRPFLDESRSLTRILAREDWAPPRSPKGLPAAFVQWFWWRIRDREPRVTREWIRLFDILDLGRDEALRSTVCQLLALAPDTALSWCRAAASVAEPRRLTFLTRLLETEACGARGSEAEARELSNLAPDDRFAAWIGEYFAALRDGRPAGYILAGVCLAAAFSPASWLQPKGWCASVPEDAIAEAALESDFLAVSARAQSRGRRRVPQVAAERAVPR